MPIPRPLAYLIAATVLALLPTHARAWGPAGHGIVGNAAVQMLDLTARDTLSGFVDITSPEAVNAACNWPDKVREQSEWDWSAPLHYVNIPRHAAHYDRQRDCCEGLCVTEGIKKYAQELGDPRLDRQRRWQAFAWLCHLVGDLHQPLHAGFRDDRGGNAVKLHYKGGEYNLHQFWDSVLIEERLAGQTDQAIAAAAGNQASVPHNWNPAETDRWTDESHALAVKYAYPASDTFGPEFTNRSWRIIQEQWAKAALRLAQIIDAVAGDGEVTP